MLSIPATCWLCQMPLAQAAQGICSVCLRGLPAQPVCTRCGLPAAAQQPCGRCLHQPPPWQRLIAVGGWQPPLSQLVNRLKFHRATALSRMLARLMLLKWLQQRRHHGLRHPDRLVVVPLHRQRAWRRGYNQCHEIACHLARWLGCDYTPSALQRRRRGKIQHRLSAAARRKNMRGLFRLEIAVQEAHIVLVDDVVTTGSTAGEISRLLLAAGAASVQVWCLCRTL